MKYWRGYLTAAIFGFFSWALMRFAQGHSTVLDMVYPYITRLIQGTLAQWTSGVDFCLWQLILVLAGLLVLATVVLMIVFKWNPIQWFGWVLAVAAAVFFLHTGLYGLNTYAGPLAEDLRMEMSEYTLQELQDATIYYRDKANALSTQVPREDNGDVKEATLQELAVQAENGFHTLVYEDYYSVFAGSTLPVKSLGWADLYTSMGITGVTMPLTGEAAVNPQAPVVSLPFTICHEMAHRMSIAVERDANFAGFLACRENDSLVFQYSGYFMAYRYCYSALSQAGGSLMAQEVSSGATQELQHDLTQYSSFFAKRQDENATQLANRANDTYIKVSGDPQGVASYGDVCDLLVNWYIQQIILPTQVEPAPEFDPMDKTQVDISDITGETRPAPTETAPEEG